ncbi:hypothetical protein [Halobacterium sp. KA-6]|uniref:hypothetical protein n=1 Tax=Halobacterium sp. KA-6 TaxID=2896368 RepID=UPI001E46948E|nr:hypothetical protein [Halobacterium sp. KA-6]MCD2204396.1 hypothetical protein [Halobacterium sp. KA-6]
MSTKPRTQDKSSDPRPNYSLLGIDNEGAHHIHDTRTNAVHVIQNGERELVQDLDGHFVSEWMHYVEGKRGWDTRFLFDSAGEAFADALEVED